MTRSGSGSALNQCGSETLAGSYVTLPLPYTVQEVKDKNKRQPINIRDDFWLVTAQKKPLVDKYMKVYSVY